MGKELIALSAVFLMTALFLVDNGSGAHRPAGYTERYKTSSYIEIVKDGIGRIYPLKDVSQNFIVTSGKPLEKGDSLEYTGEGSIIRGRMKGETLLLLGMPIRLNRAGVDELKALPGIGQKTAEAIVKFREEKGPFRTIDGLMEVHGIGRKRLEKIRGKLTI